MNYSLICLALMLVFVMFPLSDAYSMKINCSEFIDLEEYPICKYASEWNESEEFDEKVLAELTKYADEINSTPELYEQIYQKVVDKVNQDNPGLQEKCQKLQEWIYEQIKNN